MECTLCKQIVHPTCMTDYGVDGFIKMDLPNSWECPRCIKLREDAKDELKDEPDGGMLPPKVPKVEEPDPLRRKLASGSDAVIAGTYQLFSVKGTSDQVSQKTTIGFFSHCTALSEHTRFSKYPKRSGVVYK